MAIARRCVRGRGRDGIRLLLPVREGTRTRIFIPSKVNLGLHRHIFIITSNASCTAWNDNSLRRERKSLSLLESHQYDYITLPTSRERNYELWRNKFIAAALKDSRVIAVSCEVKIRDADHRNTSLCSGIKAIG